MSILTSRVEITFTEEGDQTRAEAVLDQGGERFYGVGQAKRAPGDPDVPVIGGTRGRPRSGGSLAQAARGSRRARRRLPKLILARGVGAPPRPSVGLEPRPPGCDPGRVLP